MNKAVLTKSFASFFYPESQPLTVMITYLYRCEFIGVQSVPAYRRQVYQISAAQKPGLNFSPATLA